MDFRLLGPLEVVENGAAIDVGSAKPRALLAVLLLNANRVVSRDDLVDALWGERAPGTASKALQVYVSQLRKSLGRDRILTRALGYELRVEPGELDLDRFQAFDSEGRLDEALRLWRRLTPRGVRVPAVRSVGNRAGSKSSRLACLERRIEEDLANGRHAAIIGELERLVSLHPFRERLRAAAHARPIPIRAAGRGTRCLSGRAPRADRGAWDRALARAART